MHFVKVDVGRWRVGEVIAPPSTSGLTEPIPLSEASKRMPSF